VNDTVRDSQWYIDRGSPDPVADPEPLGDEEKRAAWLAAKHHGTPGLIHTDSLGRKFYSVADYGNGKRVATWSEIDLFARTTTLFDEAGRNISSQVMNMIGGLMYSKTAEKGERWVFTDV